MTGKDTGTESLDGLSGGVDIYSRPRVFDTCHHVIEFGEYPTILGSEVLGGLFWVIWSVELAGEARHVEYFGQDTEVLGLDFLGIDVEVVTDLCIAGLPKTKALAAYFVGPELHLLAVRTFDLP